MFELQREPVEQIVIVLWLWEEVTDKDKTTPGRRERLW
jgi:hypothetical protein